MEYLHAEVRLFLGNQQLPPEHVGVVERGVLSNCMHFRRCGLTEIDIPYPDVLEFLLLQDGLISFFPHGLCPPDASQQTHLLACRQ